MKTLYLQKWCFGDGDALWASITENLVAIYGVVQNPRPPIHSFEEVEEWEKERKRIAKEEAVKDKES